jgi:hypothetical protein
MRARGADRTGAGTPVHAASEVLHDGVVHDLTGAGYAVSAVREALPPEAPHSASVILPASGSWNVPRRRSTSISWALWSAADSVGNPEMVPNPEYSW